MLRLHLFCYTQNSTILETLLTALFSLKSDTNDGSCENHNHLTKTADSGLNCIRKINFKMPKADQMPESFKGIYVSLSGQCEAYQRNSNDIQGSIWGFKYHFNSNSKATSKCCTKLITTFPKKLFHKVYRTKNKNFAERKI